MGAALSDSGALRSRAPTLPFVLGSEDLGAACIVARARGGRTRAAGTWPEIEGAIGDGVDLVRIRER